MSKNGDIRGFFSKKPSQTLAASSDINSVFKADLMKSDEQTYQSPPPLPSSQVSLDLPSSPVTPQKNNSKKPLTRDAEIKGSDDEDSDSSMESIGAMAGRLKPGPSYQRPAAVNATPKGKRVASGNFHRSPLTHQQKPKHKFDFKTLLNHARQDSATEESARRADEARAQAEKELELEPDADRMAGEALSDEDEVGCHRLTLALKRTSGDESHPRAYFFGPEEAPRSIPRRQFPKKAVKAKPWNILQDANSRKQTFMHGTPTILARKGKELPDELYLWILDEICVEKDLQLRIQYINTVTACHNNVRRLVDEQELYSLLEKIGGQKYSTVEDEFELSPGLHRPYLGRDWSSLRYFLKLLQLMAPSLALESNIAAIKLLLRLSLDPVVTTVAGLQAAYSMAMLALVCALPVSENQWDSCCKDICNYLYTRTAPASQRLIAITLLPTSTSRMVELQRRLASQALLNEPNIGARHPDNSVTIQDLFSRLSEADFQIASLTDYAELNALISLLDIVIHDGSHIYRAHLSPSPSNLTSSTFVPIPTPLSLASPSTTPSPNLEAEARARYDKDIDTLLRKFKVMHDKISDNTLVIKKEAKAAMDGLMKRLNHTVRSRPQPKEDIFEGILVKKDDVDLPRQKDFMKKWAAAKAAKTTE